MLLSCGWVLNSVHQRSHHPGAVLLDSKQPMGNLSGAGRRWSYSFASLAFAYLFSFLNTGFLSIVHYAEADPPLCRIQAGSDIRLSQILDWSMSYEIRKPAGSDICMIMSCHKFYDTASHEKRMIALHFQYSFGQSAGSLRF
jgi:hypothetical protein